MKKKLLLVSYLLSKIFLLLPVFKVIVFESRSDFCDNSKALFYKMIEYGVNDDYKIYWLVEDKNKHKDIKFSNVKFLQISSTSFISKVITDIRVQLVLSICKYYFFTHRNLSKTKFKKNQVFFNLTHATPLKNSTGLHNNVHKSTYTLTTSDFAGSLRLKTYASDCLTELQVLGFPRNDNLFLNLNSFKKIGINKQEYKKILVWMPTFRRHKNNKRNDSGTNKAIDIPLINELSDMKKLNEFLSENENLLIIKIHQAQNLDFIKKEDYSHIKILTNDDLLESKVEMYSLLAESDALVTDYSSVFLDYLLLNKPIAFTVDDIEDYSKNLGFLVDNILDFMPGQKITIINDLFNFVNNLNQNIDEYSKERIKINDIFNLYKDGNSSKRILQFLKLKK